MLCTGDRDQVGTNTCVHTEGRGNLQSSLLSSPFCTHRAPVFHQGLTSTEMPRALGPIVTVPTFTRKSQYW